MERLTTFFRERMVQRGQEGATVEGVLGTITIGSIVVFIVARSVLLMQGLGVLPGGEFMELSVQGGVLTVNGEQQQVVTGGLEGSEDELRVFSAPPGLKEITVRAPKSKAKRVDCVEVTGKTLNGERVVIGTYEGDRSNSFAPTSSTDPCSIGENVPTVSGGFGL